jgi:hypothetical protein
VTSTGRRCGNYLTYKAGCRCASCTAANTAKCARDRDRRSANPAGADQAGHGKPSTYINYRCRCDACRSANTAAGRVYKQRRRAQ